MAGLKAALPAFLVLAALVSSGCVQQSGGGGSLTGSADAGAGDGGNVTATYTLSEVENHGSADDCWLVIDGKVYDVTDFISLHPGGAAILEGCGKDATSLFETRPMGSGTPHSARARSLREEYFIGDLGDA